MGRKQTTIRLDEELLTELDDEADESGVSRSEYVRQILRERGQIDELRDEVATLQQRLDDREERISELERQLSRRSEIEEKVDTLAKRQSEPDAPWPVRWLRWYRER